MEKITPVLSIIVPVYNVEQYLPRCIDSILGQTFQDFELILVDDGSPDRCGEICDEYTKKDNRIIVIHQENKGVSTARNRGLDKAKGNYIMFIDPDDSLGSNDIIKKNINILKKQKEKTFVQFPQLWYYGNEKDTLIGGHYYSYKNKDEIYQGLLKGNITTVIWDKIYSKEIFSNIRFPGNLRYYEDSYCMIDIIHNVEKVIISNEGYYKYCIREGSSMQSSINSQKLQDYFEMTTRYINLALAIKNTELFRVQKFLTMKDQLAHCFPYINRNIYFSYINKLSKLTPNYQAIFLFMFKQNFRKGIKAMLIKLLGIRLYISIIKH